MTYRPNELQPGETMTTDQRLAIALTTDVARLGGERARLTKEMEAYTDQAMKDALERQLGHISRAYDRLVEITEALAGGSLFVVDEYTMVQSIQWHIEEDRRQQPRDAAEALHYTPLRVAQLTLQDMKDKGAIR